MASLIGTDVAANYQKYSATSQMGTRRLRFLKVLLSGGTPTNISTNYGNPTSNFAKAARTFQTYFETFALYAPSTSGGNYAFYALVADDTAQDNLAFGQPTSTEVTSSTYADCEAAILAVLGSWGSGAVTISEITPALGGTL